MKFQRKPQTVDAVQYVGRNADEVREFCPAAKQRLQSLVLPTRGGGLVLVFVGDWIVKGEDGHFWALAPEDFATMYEPKANE